MKKTFEQLKPWRLIRDRTNALRLDLNENIYAPTKEVMRILRTFNDETINVYPYYDRLLQALSTYTGMPKHSILPTNGASQAIIMAIRTLFNTDDNIVVPSPTFYPYYHFLILEGTHIVPTYYTYEQSTATWKFPFEETMHALNGARGIMLVHPNNPIGVAIPDNIIASLLREASKRDCYVVIDEAYIEFGGKPMHRFIRRYPKLIIIRTFSKFFGLSGLRLGYILARPELINAFSKTVGPWDVNRFAVFAGTRCIEHVDEFYTIKNKITKSREDLYHFFKTRGIDTWRSETNFLSIRTPSAKKILEGLAKKKILISNLSGYPYSQDLFKEALRISIPIKKDLGIFKEEFERIINSNT